MTRPFSEIVIDLLALLCSGVLLFFGLVSLVAPSLITEVRQRGWNYSPWEDTKAGQLFRRFLGLILTLAGGFLFYGIVTSVI